MSDRLDRSSWRPIHRRIAGALGIGWALDAFEVQIIGSVIPSIASDFGLSKAKQIAVFVIWFAGLGIGATLFGYLADRVGRRRLFPGLHLVSLDVRNRLAGFGLYAYCPSSAIVPSPAILQGVGFHEPRTVLKPHVSPIVQRLQRCRTLKCVRRILHLS
jgi:MFS family permease